MKKTHHNRRLYTISKQQEKETILWTEKDIDTFYQRLKEEIFEDEPLKIIWKNYKPTRTISQLRLYWMWVDQLADEFTRRAQGALFDKEYIDSLLRDRFLGYTEISHPKAKTVIKGQLKSLKNIDRSEMFSFMEDVDDWAAGLKILLVKPEKSEYRSIQQEQRGGN